ncbi:hypothetical protein V6N13_129370 [Hibiscus sabdariffa]|uniref:Uncharacterized protein n=1 Tax=Hibiscus sabdariffa TaxID=183260 RepID=A0ABR2SKY3_9ROSI
MDSLVSDDHGSDSDSLCRGGKWTTHSGVSREGSLASLDRDWKHLLVQLFVVDGGDSLVLVAQKLPSRCMQATPVADLSRRVYNPR